MTNFKQIIKHVPVPIAGVALGFTALGNLVLDYSEGIRLLCGGIGAVLMILLFARMIMSFDEVRQEFKNPIIAGVSATIFMTMMQLSTYIYPYIGPTAKGIWFVAVFCHMVLICWYTYKFLFRFKLDEIYPTCFITYVGIVVGSVTSAAFQMEWLGAVIFWFGFSVYMVMLILVTWRYVKHEVQESAKPLFCIFTAPMSLSLTGYVTVMADKSLPFMIIMEIAAQILFLVVLIQLPKLLKLSFYPSYAAFTFPFVITAFGLKKMLICLDGMGVLVWRGVHVLMVIETMIAVFMVTYTLIRYVIYLLGYIKCRKSEKILC